MKRLFLIVCCVFLLITCVSAANDTTSVTALTTVITLAKDGSSTVSSEISVHFSGSESSFRIPMGKDAEVLSFDRSYDTTTKNDIEYVVLKSNAGLSGDQVFHLTYSLSGEVIASEGMQHLDLTVIAGGFSCPVEKGASFLIEFPKDLISPPELYSGSHTDNAFSDFDIQIDGSSFHATLLLSKMQEYDTLRLKADLPEDYFSLHYMPGTTQSFDSYLFLALMALCVIYWFFRLRNGLFLAKKRKILPLNINAGELGYQITCDKPDLTAMVMQWANLGYLSLYRNRKGRVILRKKMDMGSEVRPLEQKVFLSLFRNDEVCDGGSLRYRSLLKKVCQPFSAYWSHRLFERHSGSIFLLRLIALAAAAVVSFMAFDMIFGSFALRWVLIPLLTVPATYLSRLIQMGVVGSLRRRRRRAIVQALLSILILYILGKVADCTTYMVLNLLLQCFAGLATIFGGQRSRYGADRLLQLLGFRKYLREATKSDLLRSLQNDSLYFYHTLPYAEVLGLGKRFSKLFGEIQMEPCAWLDDAGGVPVTAAEFYALYMQIVDALRQEDSSPLTLLSFKKKKNSRGRYIKARQPQPQAIENTRRQKTSRIRPHRLPTQDYMPEEEYDYQ